MRFYLYVLAQKEQAKQHREGRTSGSPAFSTLARRFLAPQEQGATRARRPIGPAGSAGLQRLRPYGDARPPREQGAGALRFVSDGAAAGADGGRPTSRSLPPAKACVERRCLAPQGQGALPVCGGDAVCPCGAKALQSWRAWFWFVAGESRKSGRFAHQERLAGAPGEREISDAGMRATPLQPFCADKIQISVPSARPVSHAIPQGDRRALPAPAQGIHPLRIPFWGTAAVSLQLPSPKTPQAAGPCSWACRRLLPPPPQPNQNAATPPHS